MRTRSVLILCTGNSARSIMGEVIASSLPDIRGYSGGSRPRGELHAMAISVLESKGHNVWDLESKSWTTFAEPGAPRMDIVITVCDNAARETCPVWPGHPVQVHWGLPDPAAVEQMSRQRIAFEDIYADLKKRLTRLAELDFDALSDAELKAAAEAIHEGR
ncbi:arsenate reductase ArsC [Henriciella sp. AS95]|uniref:arsenate reductase ArsC n=1 Tax=Henriciella sp. AS95 TaxID=3135782 RepID=UPI00317271D2